MEGNFIYAEYAIGGANKRNIIRNVNEFKLKKEIRDCFRSVFLYDCKLKKYVDEKKSVKEFSGQHIINGIYFDFDNLDLEISRSETIKFVLALFTNYDLSVESLKIYFSGSKGFHVIIPFSFFTENIEAKENNWQIHKAIAEELAKGFEIDHSIYGRNKIFRIENTINKKSGLFKIELTFSELNSLSISQIKELAKDKRETTHNKIKDNQVNSLLNNVFKKWNEYDFEKPENKFIIDNILNNENILIEGVNRGQRHNKLLKIFGKLKRKGIAKEDIIAIVKLWNEKNRPPFPENELTKEIKDLLTRNRNKNDGKFLQFQHCLIGMQGDSIEIVKKIICYSVLEFGEDEKILKELNLLSEAKKYHNECKQYVEDYEIISGISYIVRIGTNLLIETINKKNHFEIIKFYIGIVSYLGRDKNKPAKTIINDTIIYRACGYKDKNDYLRHNEVGEKKRIPTDYMRRKATKIIHNKKLITVFSLKKGRINYYSTFIKTDEELMEFVVKRSNKKLDEKIKREELRLRAAEKIKEKENEYNRLKMLIKMKNGTENYLNN